MEIDLCVRMRVPDKPMIRTASFFGGDKRGGFSVVVRRSGMCSSLTVGSGLTGKQGLSDGTA